MTTTNKKWDEDREAKLTALVKAQAGEEVSATDIEGMAEALECSTRSIGSKLRSMGYKTQSSVAAKAKTFSEEQEAEIKEFLEENSGFYTYAEIAAKLFDGSKSSRQVQGKILSMEMTEHVKPTEKQEVAKAYTDEEQEVFIQLAEAGAYLEDIADKLGRELNSVRGKALSLNRQQGLPIPKQRDVIGKKEDLLAGITDRIGSMTVAEIAAHIDRTERGVKYMLTHRGLTAANYDGAKKKAKREEKASRVD